MNLHDKAKRELAEAEVRFNEALTAVEDAPEDIEAEDLVALNTALDEAEADVVRTRAEEARTARLYKAREESRQIVPAEDQKDTRISVSEPDVYTKYGKNSFFGDMVRASKDPRAAKRLMDHTVLEEERGREARLVDDGASSGGGFIPPVYLADEWAKLARPGRPFADKVPTMPMPPAGETITIPKVNTGTSVAPMASSGTAVTSVDIATTTVTSPLVTIAGQNDIARQTLERSYPGLDQVIFDDLLRAYNAKLDQQLLEGSGSAGQHLGINAVSGVNTVTYTDTAPTGSALLTKVYDAIQKIASNRFEYPEMIIMHPRRAAWLAATQTTQFPVFQQGGLFHAVGEQDNGFVGTFAGLPVLQDANISITQGASTNQDNIYVVYSADYRLAEDALRQATFEEVLSGNLSVRLQLFAYSFWSANRYAKSTTVISGTGLVTPVF